MQTAGLAVAVELVNQMAAAVPPETAATVQIARSITSRHFRTDHVTVTPAAGPPPPDAAPSETGQSLILRIK
jgi:hypothetical protein